jgi:hypothetical protein
VLQDRDQADAEHSQHDRYDNRLPAWTARRPVVVCYAGQLMVSFDSRLAIALVQRGTISWRSQLPPDRPQAHGQKIEPNPTIRHKPLRRCTTADWLHQRPRPASAQTSGCCSWGGSWLQGPPRPQSPSLRLDASCPRAITSRSASLSPAISSACRCWRSRRHSLRRSHNRFIVSGGHRAARVGR